MLRSITATQFMTWQAYAALEPFGEERDDYRAASIVQMLANVNRDPKKHKDGFAITDFLLRFGDSEGPRAEKKDWKQMKAMTQFIAEAYKDNK
jgi:hypothetical protein